MFRFQDAEEGLRKANKCFERFMPVLTPTGVVLGLLLSSFFAPMKPLVTWLFAFLTLVNGMGVSPKDFSSVIRRPKPVLAFLLLSYLILPLLVAMVSYAVFRGNQEIIIGFVLLYSIPTAVAACIWSGIYSGNGALSLTVLIIGTLLAPIATPLTVKVLGGSEIAIDTNGMIISLLWMVVIPSIAGIAINALTKGKCAEHVSPCLKPFTKIALLLVIVINTSQVAGTLLENASLKYLQPFAAALVFSVVGFILSFLLSRAMNLAEKDTVSVVFASGMRNISAAMVIAINFFPPESAIPVISGIVFQQSASAISSHFLFGRKPKNDINKSIEKESAIHEKCQ